MPSEYVRIPRADLERILRDLKKIAGLDPSSPTTPSWALPIGGGYPYLFGRAQGGAKQLVGDIEFYLNQKGGRR